MKLYIMRHGIAVPRGMAGYEEDDTRPLTEEGKEKVEGVCQGLEHLEPHWEIILTSPYTRAKQTAEIVAGYFEISHLVQEEEVLTPGHTTSQLASALQGFPDLTSVLIVGHENSISQHLSSFLFGSSRGRFNFKKAGVACLDFPALPEEGEGTLEWFMSPSQMRRLGKKR